MRRVPCGLRRIVRVAEAGVFGVEESINPSNLRLPDRVSRQAGMRFTATQVDGEYLTIFEN